MEERQSAAAFLERWIELRDRVRATSRKLAQKLDQSADGTGDLPRDGADQPASGPLHYGEPAT
jgi:hypothetical protein